MHKPIHRIYLGLMILMMVLALSVGLAWAGSLEPPASAVDGSGNPVPTTIDALDQLQSGQDSLRLQPIDDGDIWFVNLFLGRVLDNRTGLVWEQSPGPTTRNHASSLAHCDGLSLAGQDDWRLPERDELASLVDLDNPGGTPDLPPGHPFINVQSSPYWSATSVDAAPARAWVVDFFDGRVTSADKAFSFCVWCVR